jgi:hypothetical protein
MPPVYEPCVVDGLRPPKSSVAATTDSSGPRKPARRTHADAGPSEGRLTPWAPAQSRWRWSRWCWLRAWCSKDTHRAGDLRPLPVARARVTWSAWRGTRCGRWTMLLVCSQAVRRPRTTNSITGRPEGASRGLVAGGWPVRAGSPRREGAVRGTLNAAASRPRAPGGPPVSTLPGGTDSLGYPQSACGQPEGLWITRLPTDLGHRLCRWRAVRHPTDSRRTSPSCLWTTVDNPEMREGRPPRAGGRA